MIILANLAQSMMDCGNNVEALNCAQTVLKQVRLANIQYLRNKSCQGGRKVEISWECKFRGQRFPVKVCDFKPK